jgi:hypothetical protein
MPEDIGATLDERGPFVAPDRAALEFQMQVGHDGDAHDTSSQCPTAASNERFRSEACLNQIDLEQILTDKRENGRNAVG